MTCRLVGANDTEAEGQDVTASTTSATTARSRASVRRRWRWAGAAVVTVAALMAASSSGPAIATGTTPGSSLSKAAQVDQGTLAITPKVTILGIINATTLLGAITSSLVNPLLALPGNLTTSLANGLTGAGLQATNPANQQPRPSGGGLPTCGTQGWDSTDCYGPVLANVAAAPLVTLSTGALQGYATGDSAGYIAASQAANPVLNLLGISLGNLGVASSSAQCSTTPTCSATHGLTGGSLFGGGLLYSIANGTMLASVGGLQVGATPITVINGVTAMLGGNLLTLNISLTLTQLLGAIGTTLGALGTALGGILTDSGTSLNLVVTVGPGAITTGTSTQASAWGLDLAVDLTGSISLNLGLLAQIGIALGRSDPTKADLIDLKFAYSSATAGALLPAYIPAALI